MPFGCGVGASLQLQRLAAGADLEHTHVAFPPGIDCLHGRVYPGLGKLKFGGCARRTTVRAGRSPCGLAAVFGAILAPSAISFTAGGDFRARLRYPVCPMASLALETAHRPAHEHPPRPSSELIDSRAIAADLEKLAKRHGGNERELRAAVAQRLKAALDRRPRQGRAAAAQGPARPALRRAALPDGRRDHPPAVRLRAQASIRRRIRPRPSTWRSSPPAAMAAACRRPAPTSICCSCLPYKQTAWGEQVAEAILYCLWDTGLKVGHATRSVDECIRQAKADMTIRTAILEARFLLGDRKLFDELVTRFDHEVVRNSAAQFVAAKLAEREERIRKAGQSRYLVEPNVKDGKGGLRDLHTLFWIAKYVYRVREPDELIEARRVRQAGISAVPPLRGFPLVGALPHALRHRARRGAAVVRHPARDRGAARLHRASRPEGRRALHEALLPGRQGRRRPHRHSVAPSWRTATPRACRCSAA